MATRSTAALLAVTPPTRIKDPTNALRQRKHHAKKAVTAPLKSQPISSEAIPDAVTLARIVPRVMDMESGTPGHATDAPAYAADRTVKSRPLTILAYGFFALGIAINVWNAWSAGNWADTALPAAMGVLAEGVVFFCRPGL